MIELTELVYNQIKSNSEFKSYTGASSEDPRIYKSRTPIHVQINESKPAYGVFYKSGTIYSSNVVSFVGRNDHMYVVEVYGKTDRSIDLIGYCIEKIFRDKRFTTTNFIVNHTYASRGPFSFDDARMLYFESVQIYLTHVLSLYESS
jgi:hypothetical protein